jgi:putative integral membrane protein (TIGR02587 family)
MGKIALQAVPVSIGASIASSHFDTHSDETERRREHATLFPSVGMGIGGALVFGFNAAATEEPMVIGDELTWMHAVAIVVLSIVMVCAISYGIGKQRLGVEPLSRPWFGFYVRESLVTYAAALLVAAYILWTFGRIDAGTGLAPAVHMTLALGLVTTLGATAGELLI